MPRPVEISRLNFKVSLIKDAACNQTRTRRSLKEDAEVVESCWRMKIHHLRLHSFTFTTFISEKLINPSGDYVNG